MHDQDSFPEKQDFRESFKLLYINIV